MIQQAFGQYVNEFTLTAGGYHKWYLEGNRLVFDKGVISGLDRFRPSNRSYYCPADFDIVIFIGQYIQPTRYFHGDSLLSDSLISEMIYGKDFLLRLRAGHATDAFRENVTTYPPFFRNQPLEYFLKIARGRLILVQDPIPNSPSYRKVPINYKSQFQSAVVSFCTRHNCRLILQRPDTLSSDLTTKPSYNLRPHDYTHMSAEFWNYIVCDLEKIIASGDD